MHRVRPSSWCAAAFALFAGLALADQAPPDMTIPAGQPATGDIAFEGEEDRIAVDLLAGMKVTFTAKPSKGSPLVCAGDVLDPAESVVVVDAKQRALKKGAVTLKSVAATESGTFYLAVRGTGTGVPGATGQYDLTTKVTAPPAVPKVSATLTAGATADLTVEGLAGTLVSVSVVRGKGSGLVPRIAAVLDPDGLALDLTSVKKKETATSVTLTALPLPEAGTYTIRLEGAAGSGGSYTASITRKLAKASKTKKDLRGGSGGAADSGTPTAIEIVPATVAVAGGATKQLIAKGTYAGGRVRDLTRTVAWSTRNRAAASVSDTTDGLLSGVGTGGTTVQAWLGATEAREALVLVGGATVASVDVLPAAPRTASGEAVQLQAVATFSAGGNGTEAADVARAADWAQTGSALTSVTGGRAVGGGTAATSQVTAAIGGVTSAARDVAVAGRRVVSIAVSPSYAELTTGSPARTFTASATYSDGTTADVSTTATFACDNLAAATLSTRTLTRVANGTAGLRATLDGVTSRAAVANCGPTQIASIAVTGSASVAKGATRDLKATALFLDGGSRDVTDAVTWSSSATAVATVSSAAGTKGRVTGVATSGTATITASITISGTPRSGTLLVTAAAPEVRALRIVPAVTATDAARAVPLRAFATLSDGSTADVSASATWTSSASSVATVAAGDVTGVAAGGAIIEAETGGVRAASVVLVGAGRATSIALAPSAAEAAIGESVAAVPTITFTPAGGTATLRAGAAEFSSDPVGAPFAAGVVTARRVVTADVSAAFAGLVSSSATFDGRAAAPRTVTVFPQAPGVAIVNDVQLAAQLAGSDGAVVDASASATWQSLQTNVATVNSTGLVHPVAKGTATVRATVGALTGDAAVQVLGDAPTVFSVSPTTVLRGSSGNTLTITGTALDSLSPMASISGTGITITSGPTASSSTTATIVIDVAANATTGSRDLTYSNVVGSSTLVGAFQVIVPPPTITSVVPANADIPVSSSQNTSITVTGTNFNTGDTLSIGSLTGVSLSNIVVVNSTTMTATVNVQSTASRTRTDVTVSQSLANGGASATKSLALKIGPADPIITSMEPSYFLPGQAPLTARIRGTGFLSGISTTFPGAASAGVTIGSITRVSSTEITYSITVPHTATIGLQDVVLQNTGDISNTLSGAFAIAPRDPVISSFSAAALAKGVTNVDVVVKGANFRSGATLAASGTGVSFSSVSVVDPETITAKASVTSNATTGARSFSVAHASNEGGRSATLASAFTVVDASPTVTSLNPAKLGRTGSGGATRRFPVVITGTNFSHGASVALSKTSASGLTVVTGSPRTTSATTLAFEVDVAGTATTGFWDVLVTNPTGGGNSGTTGNAKLEIMSETVLAVNRVIASSGTADGGERVTVQGSGFVRGCRVEFAAEKAPAVQFIDQNTLVCTVPAPGNPSSASAKTLSATAATSVDVKVTNSPGGSSTSATLTNGYAYAADLRTLKINAGFPPLAQTGVPQNLKSAILRMSAPVNTATPVIGATSSLHCFWFESANPTVSGQTVGFGADRRFLVFSRTSGGNLPIAGTGKYVLSIPVAVKSDAGASLLPVWVSSTTFDQWNFTLGNGTTDTGAPTISSSTPASSATGVATNTAVTVVFSEEIDPLTFTTSSVQLKQGSNVVTCSYALGDDYRTVTLTPTEELATSTQYTISVTATLADLCGNAITATTRTFTTWASDTTAPTIDAVVLADLPSSLDGSTTYIPGPDDANASGPSAAAFDAYLPTSGWTVRVRFSDLGTGVDPATFSAKASAAVGSTAANAELASKFTVTGTEATWTILSTDAIAAGDDVTLTFTIRDRSNNLSSSSVVTFDTVALDTTASGAGGGDHDPFDTRETWVLRFDRDVYSGTFSTASTTQQLTTTAASNGVPDIEEALRLNGLQSTNMTTAAAATVNGSSTGTNAIVVRLFQERVRASMRVRFGIAEDGATSANSANIEFLLPGEKGSLTGLPAWSSSSASVSSNAYSEMDIGGDTTANSSQTGTFTTLGRATSDTRNRGREANINNASTVSNNVGVFAINIFKGTANLSTGFKWNTRVTSKFQAAKGGTPVGEHAEDDDVLAGAFDRTSTNNTQAQNDRYDAIMDAIEACAMSISGVTAHEIGHSVGLVADSGPKKGMMGNVHHTNTFTEATASSNNTTAHMNYLGNDIMSPASSVDDRTATGLDIMRFSPYDLNYLLHRQVHDEGK